ncbi:MAG: substrate-binding domain-containing protein, partial [Tannerella sp.]|nr:substrate-binding domain-containing protein [Tannerella sp.]
MKRMILYGLLCLLSGLTFSCKKKASKGGWDDTLHSGFIQIACDANFKTLMNAEIQVFEAHNPQAVIVPVYTTEKEAIQLLVEDSVRLALATRDLTRKERATMLERNMDAKKHLIAFDGVALIINKQNTDSAIGLAELKKILTGEITEWSQLNPDSPYGTIRVIFDNKESGILRYVADSLLQGADHSPNLFALENCAEVIEKVIEMPNTIGLIGANVLSDENSTDYLNCKDKISLMSINGYLPFAGDIVQENYPLWRPVYVLLSDPRSGLSSGLSIFLA